jgi:hypothetical protein
MSWLHPSLLGLALVKILFVALLQLLTCQSQAQLVRFRIVSWNWVTCFGISFALFCCAAAKVSGGPGMTAQHLGYGVFSGPAETDRVFNQMMERRDIKMAINTLVGEGFTSGEIQDAVQNRYVRIGSWPGYYCSASGKIGEPGEGTVVGPTYYLITGRARILRWYRQVGAL